MKEAISRAAKDSTEVVSEDEGDISIEDIANDEGSFSKGSAKRRNPYSNSLTSNKLKTSSVCPTALLTQKQDSEILCCIFPGSLLECKKQIDEIFAEETAMHTLMESKSMKNTFKNTKQM